MSRITTTVLAVITASIMTIILCSCSRQTANSVKRDMKNAKNGVMDMFDGETSSNGENYSHYSRRNGVVTGGDTVGNAVSGIMGSRSVGERDGMTGTSTHGSRNPAAGKYRTGTNSGQVNTNNGSADGGHGDMYSDMSTHSNTTSGINARNAGGSGNPNYTK